jgi:polyisoprenoid-binding protein YceI
MWRSWREVYPRGVRAATEKAAGNSCVDRHGAARPLFGMIALARGLGLLAAFAVPLAAQGPIPDAPLHRGTLRFDGDATLGDFVGSTDSVRGAMTGGATLAAVRGWVAAPVATLLTGNGRRDKDLRKSMEVERYPTMRFDLDAVTVEDTVGATTVAVTLVGRLTIHGVERPVSLPAQVWRSDHGWHVRSDFPLNLKDYGIGGLSKMLGLLKMSEHIVVHVDLTFGP